MEILGRIALFVINLLGIYIAALATVRLMGKRALGELSLFDLVIMVGIGEVIVIVGLEQQVSFTEGLLILILLGLMEYSMSWLTFKYRFLADLLEGKPTLLIKDGRIIERNLAREHISLSDLRQELRKQGISDLSRVSRAVLESCGQFSVICLDDVNSQSESDENSIHCELAQIKAELRKIRLKIEQNEEENEEENDD